MDITVRTTTKVEREIVVKVSDVVAATTLTEAEITAAIEGQEGAAYDGIMMYVLDLPGNEWTLIDDTDVTVDEAYLDE